MRLDQYLSEHYNLTRTKAKQLIEATFVVVNNVIITKPSYNVNDIDNVKILENFKYASLGGDKLAKAFLDFNYSVKDKICLDIGASNGGFTDCMLKNGAKKVYAVDVGECAFSDELKNNEKIIIKDRLNARYIKVEDIGELCDFASIDISFISLKLVLENIKNLLSSNGDIIALIKPQFEAGQKNLTKKGIIKSQKIIDKVIEDIKNYAISINLKIVDITIAPIRPNKNKEYLIYLTKKQV